MWSNWAEKAQSSVTQALEKTGDALSKAATNAGKSAREKKTKQEQEQQNDQALESPPPPDGAVKPPETTGSSTSAPSYDQQNHHHQPTIAAIPAEKQPPPRPEKLFLNNISKSWSNVVETTKASMKQAEEKIQQQQLKIKNQLVAARRPAYYKRDPTLPLDVEALRDAEVVYITDRIITMGHPALPSQTDTEITGERKLAAIGHLLNRRHNGRFMVWNLSEVDYDIDILDDQVLTYSFPGTPSPPLGLMLKLLVSMESWMKADSRNIAVVHCLTGKGRSSTVLAAFLCWMGQASFSDMYEALEYIANCKQLTAEELTIPSQRRYVSYFKNMLDGVRPSQPPLMLRRIIMSEAPRYAKGPPREQKEGEDNANKSTATKDDETQLLGCVPYIQIFKAGKLLQTAPASLHFQQGEKELPFCQVADGNISFHINLAVQGDILVRARHLTAQKKKVSMFRAAFHTGYAPPNVMRLTKSQLDGACGDERFVEDFFVDFIFEPVDAEEASKLLQDEDEKAGDDTSAGGGGDAARDKRAKAVRASPDDSMLHRDSRFWEVIATRMKQHAADNSESSDDPLWGPTVGRRREYGDVSERPETTTTSTTPQEQNALETFSIGGEYDFLPETVEGEETKQPPASPEQVRKAEQQPKKPDSLMEALLGALDDSEAGPDEQEEEEEEEMVEFHPADANEGQKDGDKDESAVGSSSAQSGSSADQAKVAAAPEQQQDSTSPDKNKSSSDDVDGTMENLLEDANLNLDADMDAALAGVDDDDLGMTDEDLLNLDVDDAELEDLENFLSS